ncbi:MAG TPA: hypothetical protein EYP77_06810 [Anaerolineae bacterium]|nr:hypothetical protein [Anaerolineae bacterium]
MQKPDFLDYLVLAALAVLAFLVGPALAGRALSPYEEGRPVLLTADLLAERRYLETARSALQVATRADRILEEADRQAGQGVTAWRQADGLQGVLGELDATAQILENAAPPPRFSGLHQAVVEAVTLYRAATAEALAFYGDLNHDHWTAVRQARQDGAEAVAALTETVGQLTLPVGPPETHREPAGEGGGEGRSGELEELEELETLP